MHATETSLHGEQQWPEISTHTEKRESSEIDFSSSKRHDLFAVLPDGAKEGLSLLSQPPPRAVLSWKLLGSHTHFGAAAVCCSSETWGNWFKQRGFFPPTYPTGSAHWDWRSLLLEGRRKHICSRVTHYLCLSQVLGLQRDGGTSQKAPCGGWKTALYGFVFWVVGRMEEWDLGILLLLCPWNTAPSLLPFCSCGVALRMGSNTPYQSVLVSLASNTLIFFFPSLFF